MWQEAGACCKSNAKPKSHSAQFWLGMTKTGSGGCVIQLQGEWIRIHAWSALTAKYVDLAILADIVS